MIFCMLRRVNYLITAHYVRASAAFCALKIAINAPWERAMSACCRQDMLALTEVSVAANVQGASRPNENRNSALTVKKFI
jgi:hypothetical protein